MFADGVLLKSGKMRAGDLVVGLVSGTLTMETGLTLTLKNLLSRSKKWEKESGMSLCVVMCNFNEGKSAKDLR